MRVSGRTTAYLAFAGFCILSSCRDVLSEILFKDQQYDASPVFVLFVYSAVTQAVAVAVFVSRLVSGDLNPRPSLRSACKEILLLNFFTLAAFLLYFVAIDSPVGAAVNSFVDYGSSPIFTAMVGILLMQERLDRIFVWSRSE